MEVQKTRFGFSDEELKALPTVYRADLFSGKTVVVSGGGSGFGKAIACLLARLGANVAICGRNEEKLAATVPLLESMGVRVFSAPLTTVMVSFWLVPNSYPPGAMTPTVAGRVAV